MAFKLNLAADLKNAQNAAQAKATQPKSPSKAPQVLPRAQQVSQDQATGKASNDADGKWRLDFSEPKSQPAMRPQPQVSGYQQKMPQAKTAPAAMGTPSSDAGGLLAGIKEAAEASANFKDTQPKPQPKPKPRPEPLTPQPQPAPALAPVSAPAPVPAPSPTQADSAGLYTVSSRVPLLVGKSQSTTSTTIAKFQPDTPFSVSEVATLEGEHRVRGKIESGWISLFDTKVECRWAAKVEADTCEMSHPLRPTQTFCPKCGKRRKAISPPPPPETPFPDKPGTEEAKAFLASNNDFTTLDAENKEKLYQCVLVAGEDMFLTGALPGEALKPLAPMFSKIVKVLQAILEMNTLDDEEANKELKIAAYAMELQRRHSCFDKKDDIVQWQDNADAFRKLPKSLGVLWAE